MPSLRVPLQELNLKYTLPSGQCFRWRKRQRLTAGDEDVWIGIIGQDVFSLSQDVSKGLLNFDILNRRFTNEDSDEGAIFARDILKTTSLSGEEMVKSYFQLNTSLHRLYDEWSQMDPLFSSVGNRFPGVRVMRQDPVENLFSFICSSCNNIKRISQMIDRMCSKFGRFLMHDHEFGDLYSFPTIESLAQPGVEQELRSLGFGYRAAFIHKAAGKILTEKICLEDLRNMTHDEARGQLMQLSGVGRKVADCICLFSLDQTQSIPVDTHVFQIASRHYLKHLSSSKSKTISEKVYNEVSSALQQRFGKYAGWAHSVLFTADLSMFKNEADPDTKSPPVSKKRKSSHSR